MKTEPTFLKGYYGEPISQKVAFDAWVDTGTLDKAAKMLADQGFMTRRGNPVSPNTVNYAAWKYILHNPDIARPYFDADYEIVGRPVPTDDEWAIMLVKKAMRIFLSRRPEYFQSWIEKNEYERFCYIYESEYPEAYEAHKKYLGEVQV